MLSVVVLFAEIGWHDDATSLKISYVRAITGWWNVQPELQWIINPGGRADHALAIGLRTGITF